MTESNNDNAGGSIETSENEARPYQPLILSVPERLREYAESQCAGVPGVKVVVPKLIPMDDVLPPEPYLYQAALDCSHTIDNDKITLYRDPKLEGNTLSQLDDRLDAALEKLACHAASRDELIEWKAIIHDDGLERGDRLQRVSSRISEILDRTAGGAEITANAPQSQDQSQTGVVPKPSAYDYTPEKLWMIHILGPDDIYAAPSMVDAYEQAAMLQRYLDLNGSKSENAPTVTAVVVEWDGTAEAHAKNLAAYWSDFVSPVIEKVAEMPQEQAPQIVIHSIPCRRFNPAVAGAAGIPACPSDCPCWPNEQQPAPLEHVVQYSAEFQNFHRMLCERFGYSHDPKDWWRDQVSLMEHIAGRVAAQTAVEPLTDEEILAMNKGEIFFSETPTRFPESGHGTQYHCGAPGLLKFSRALLSTNPTSKAANPCNSSNGSFDTSKADIGEARNAALNRAYDEGVSFGKAVALKEAAAIAFNGPLIRTMDQYLYMTDDCKAMAVTVSNRILALKSATPSITEGDVEVPGDTMDRFYVGKATAGDQMLAYHALWRLSRSTIKAEPK